MANFLFGFSIIVCVIVLIYALVKLFKNIQIQQECEQELRRLKQEEHILKYGESAIMSSLDNSTITGTHNKSNKDASVVGRAVVGGIVAGPAGAVVGALSAVDKNNKKNK